MAKKKVGEQEKKRAAKDFSNYWKDKGYEKGESQKFWIDLLEHVYGVENASRFIEFEDQVHIDHTSFIDGYIPDTKVLIEQKSINKSLRAPIKQSDGSLLTPFQQAKRYSAELPYSKRPRWIITCNFAEFLVYDMENPNAEPEQILLKNLPNETYRLNFLTESGNEHIKKEMKVSLDAGQRVGELYKALRNQYDDPDSPESLKYLNILCVRLVFCLYAEDAEVFNHNLFHDYLESYPTKHWQTAIINLFNTLDTKIEDRNKYIEEDLAAFPYVNGGMFDKKIQIDIPQFTEDIRDIILNKCSAEFDWSEISPTIFGAVFESTLNPETRRKGGMHYTSIENIHKVIDPLFLNDLREELENIKLLKQDKVKNDKLYQFCDKLATLKFLDPACGSGNFLTETYISLRTLENEALKIIHRGNIPFGFDDYIKVKIDQFYGIEINDFAVTVAKTALWIAENQMMQKTIDVVNQQIEFLPLSTNAHIVEGNALQIDWNKVVDKNELNYIMGNPPFVGARLMSKEQKQDLLDVFGKIKGIGNIDYVSGWYKKACNYTENTNIYCALVSTNSVTQGEQPALLWKPLFESGIGIDFCHRTFRWDSEAAIKAHVHCVIIGFSHAHKADKYIYENGKITKAKNINAYLVNSVNVFVESRRNPLCEVPKMDFGSMPNDGGYLSNYTTEEKNIIVARYPKSEKLFKLILGATEFINKKERWCLWLKDISPVEYVDIPPVCEAIKKAKELRESSNREATRKLADIPMLFGEIRQPDVDYLLVPKTSSENRRYIPIGFYSPDIISSDANLVVPNADLYTFGVLTSNVHMAWLRAVCGRLKSDYRYSVNIVYNNFPWCNPTLEQKAKIESTAQAILDAREKYKECSMAQLYGDKFTFFTELLNAHRGNDRAVMAAYGFSTKMTESECVAELMKLYSELTK